MQTIPRDSDTREDVAATCGALHDHVGDDIASSRIRRPGWWTVLSASGEPPFPALADLGFLAFAALAIVALALHPSGGGGPGRWQKLLDGVMTTASVGFLSWQTALGEIMRAAGHGLGELVLLAAYPASDVVLVVLTQLLITRTSGRRTGLPLSPIG